MKAKKNETIKQQKGNQKGIKEGNDMEKQENTAFRRNVWQRQPLLSSGAVWMRTEERPQQGDGLVSLFHE